MALELPQCNGLIELTGMFSFSSLKETNQTKKTKTKLSDKLPSPYFLS